MAQAVGAGCWRSKRTSINLTKKVATMAFDFKKEYKDIYQPSKKPSIIEMPSITYVAVRGQGDPNVEGGQYQRAMQMLYGISFTIKMSPKAGHNIDGYFPYVVPPLEGFWSLDESNGEFDPARKSEFKWISCIRLPDFVTPDIFAWAAEEASKKKGADFSAAEMLTINEGMCVQCMHIGPYDDEPPTIESMHKFAAEQGFCVNLTDKRLHHEIYLSDPRRCAPERLRTVIRLPIARM